jgi:hypothetical protein
MREWAIGLYGLTGTEEAYTLYYDETNNIRRLLVGENGLNEPGLKCFVLGGIGHLGPERDLDLVGLRRRLHLQANMAEIKLDYLGKGNFPKLLSSRRILALLEWITEQHLLIHFQAIDLLYWTTVDIIDSIVAETRVPPEWIFILKNDLYAVLKRDEGAVADLYRRYAYPDVPRESQPAFLSELLDAVEVSEEMLGHFNFQMLKGILQMGRRGELPFLQDERAGVLVDHFAPFFLGRLYLFKNAIHILDKEDRVAAHLDAMTLTAGGQALDLYRFVDSKTEAGVQISDAVTGLLGKAFTWLNRMTDEEADDAKAALAPHQSRCIALLVHLLERSEAQSAGFAHYVMSLDDRQRFARFFS